MTIIIIVLSVLSHIDGEQNGSLVRQRRQFGPPSSQQLIEAFYGSASAFGPQYAGAGNMGAATMQNAYQMPSQSDNYYAQNNAGSWPSAQQWQSVPATATSAVGIANNNNNHHFTPQSDYRPTIGGSDGGAVSSVGMPPYAQDGYHGVAASAVGTPSRISSPHYPDYDANHGQFQRPAVSAVGVAHATPTYEHQYANAAMSAIGANRIPHESTFGADGMAVSASGTPTLPAATHFHSNDNNNFYQPFDANLGTQLHRRSSGTSETQSPSGNLLCIFVIKIPIASRPIRNCAIAV